MVSEKEEAPDFELYDTIGRKVRLSDLRGQPVVLYFYPKDMTPGCTIQACSYRDSISEFEKRNVRVFGVSLDSKERHQKFTEKYDLNFPLLIDSEHNVSELYGVYEEKNMLGTTYMGISRTTFIVDAEGNILKIFRDVRPLQDVENVLEVLDKINK